MGVRAEVFPSILLMGSGHVGRSTEALWMILVLSEFGALALYLLESLNPPFLAEL